MNEKIREDIPLNLPPEAETEAEHLRNKLLKFYLDHYDKFENDYSLQFDGINLRLQQILQPMLSLSKIVSPAFYDKVKEVIEELNERIIQDRANTLDGRIIRAYLKLKMDGMEKITSKEIANFMLEEWGIKINPISIGKRMAAMNFKTDRVSDKKRNRIKTIDFEREKILVKKYLPKEEREKYFEWLKEQAQEKIDAYTPLYSINPSDSSEMSDIREEVSDKSKSNLSDNFIDEVDESDKSDIYSEYTVNTHENRQFVGEMGEMDVGEKSVDRHNFSQLQNEIINILSQGDKTLYEIAKELGINEDEDNEIDYLQETLKDMASRFLIVALNKQFTRFSLPKSKKDGKIAGYESIHQSDFEFAAKIMKQEKLSKEDFVRKVKEHAKEQFRILKENEIESLYNFLIRRWKK